MRKKRGQTSGSGAAALVGIITVILIFYILFLPESERQQLLADEEEVNGQEEIVREVSLVEVTQLRLSFVGEDEFDHIVPNINLFQTTAAQELHTETPFYVRNSWFDKQSKIIEFSLDDPANTMNLLLSLQAPQRQGRLMVYFNDNVVYDFAPSQVNIGPIPINEELLQDSNTIEIKVSGVGLAFWTTNQFAIEDFKVVGDLTDILAQESFNTFTIANEEYYNLESGYVQFFPICEPAEVGRLDVLLNNRQIYSSVPDCGTINRQDIFPTDLNPGKNALVFKTSRGSYTLEQIKVKTRLRPVKSFLQYFEVNASEYSLVAAGSKRVMLRIDFVDDLEDKRADINVNGHLTRLDQRTPTYERDITIWIEKGKRNYIEIAPKTVLNIVELKVESEQA